MALVLFENTAGEEVGFGLGASSSGLQNKNPATKKVRKYILDFFVAGFGLSLSVELVVVVWRSRLAGWAADGL